jgi:hypothetical protein
MPFGVTTWQISDLARTTHPDSRFSLRQKNYVKVVIAPIGLVEVT